MKKIVSIFLTVALVLGCISTVFAADSVSAKADVSELQAGDTVKITYTFPTSADYENALGLGVQFTYDHDAFKLMSITGPSGSWIFADTTGYGGWAPDNATKGDNISGKAFVAEFACKEGTAAKAYEFAAEFVDGDCFDSDFDDYALTAPSVTVTVKAAPCAHKNVEDQAAVAATCTTDGKTAGKVCKDCGAVLVKQDVIPALGHNFKGEMKDMNDGTHAYKCTNTGCTEYGAPVAHSGSEWAGNDTQHWKECACGTKINTGDHTVVTDATVAATCTKTGLTEGKHCSECGKVLVKQEVIPALGHSYGEWAETKAPTCTEAGEKTCTCAACGDVKTEAIPALGHSYGEWAETKAPTCTEAGEKTCTCANCGDVKTEAIPALGHTTEGEWTETKAPTCTEAGVKTNTCTVCEEAVEEAIPALGHSFKDGKCTVCGEKDPNFKPADDTKPTDNTKPADPTKPETGDAGIAVWATLLAVSAVFGTAIVVKKRHA